VQTVVKGLVILLMVTLSLCAASTAQARIDKIKLLTPDTGWAATENKLYRTIDGGANWKDITPKLHHKKQFVSSVFFLDAFTGWILLHCGDERDPGADDVCFEFASTKDAGQNWSVVHPGIVDSVPQTDFTDWTGYSGKTFLHFADWQHGWAILKRNLPVGRSSGVMLRTVDGGHTWRQFPKDNIPMAEPFLFVSATDGWLTGGPSLELYVTRDAGSSWQLVSVPKPSQIGADRGTVYDLPVFENGSDGFLPVRYKVGSELGPPLTTVALFATNDRGKTWKLDRVLPKIPDPTDGWLPVALPHSFLITATVSGDRINLLSKEQAAQSKSQSAPSSVHARHGFNVDHLSFISPQRGWALTSYWLLSTTDGGASWTNVTPDPTETIPPLVSGGTPSEIVQANASTPGPERSASAAAAGNISTHLGFDKSDVVTSDQMNNLMASSPFYDAFIYLPGSPNRHVDGTLTPAWLSAVESQGWGIVPIWFGRQSLCVITGTGISQFFSATPATASTQGAEQADLAVAADRALGISGGIIYVD
jgi:photosystem II stability/assembly factor-like uncharacterized protein